VDKLSEFFLELANSERLRALSLIERERLKLTHISERLNLSMQETSRHLSRLRDAKLVRKDVDGFYHITPFGRIALRLLPGYNFIITNRDYFQDHELTWLPVEFIERIGELEEYEPGRGVMQVLHLAGVVMEEAEQYVWILTDQVMTASISMIMKGSERGIRFKIMLPEQLRLPSGFELPEPGPTSPIEIRRLREVNVCIVMNEKLAGLCLPETEGKIDFSAGFASRKPGFHKWCRDLFLQYWEEGKKARSRNERPPARPS
jgi:predicted transcriptional regulator